MSARNGTGPARRDRQGSRPAGNDALESVSTGSPTSEPSQRTQSTIIDTFEKNGRGEFIRTSISEYRGQTIVDLRVWFKGRDGELRPTKKGVGLALRHAPRLIDALQKALAAGKNGGSA